MWKPPSDELIETPKASAPAKASWSPPSDEVVDARSGGYWSDVGKNAVKEATDIAKAAPGMVSASLKLRSIPADAVEAVIDKATGRPLADTNLADDLRTVGGLVKSGPQVVAQTGKDLINTVAHPFNSFREKPLSTVGNALALAGGVTSLAEKAAPAVAEAAADASSALGRRAAGFSKGMINNGGKLAKANDTVQWMLDNKVMTPATDADEMMSRVQVAKDDAYSRMAGALKEQNVGAKGALSPKSPPQLREQFLFNPNEAISDLDELRPTAKNGKVLTGGEYDDQNAVIDKAQDTIAGHGTRPIPWDEANDLKSNLKANWDTTKSSAVNNLKKRVYGVVNDSIESQMDEAAQARGGDTKDFLQAKQDYGHAATAEKALNNLISSQQGNRQIGLTDTIAAAGGAAADGGIGAVLSVAAKRFLERYGLRTGASLGDKISTLAENAPEFLGPYSSLIKKAAAAGPAELAATHAVMVKTDPNYRTFAKGLAGRQ